MLFAFARLRRFVPVTVAGAALAIAPFASTANAANPPEIQAPLGCVDTVVTKAMAPTGSSMAAGGTIAFRDDIAPGHGAGNQKIKSVYVAPDTEVIVSAGDRVRVCLLQMPRKANGCDPASDIRGREFLVFDQAKSDGENAGVFFDGEHLCGGA